MGWEEDQESYNTSGFDNSSKVVEDSCSWNLHTLQHQTKQKEKEKIVWWKIICPRDLAYNQRNNLTILSSSQAYYIVKRNKYITYTEA